ncbi:MAG TPA: Rieske 2Fe-2S domain-containing protein [Candidatus Kapabacteria bacterium]|nr:Rieske 2Fe-2S domain-containing protein [Candidatus Kapabacteria bacterium]
MKLRFLGHAGWMIEAGTDAIMCDPWFSRYGAYAASWFQFPPNDHIALGELEKATHLFISHWHRDHFDERFLSSRSYDFKRRVQVVIAKFRYPKLKQWIEACGYGNIIELSRDEIYTTPSGTQLFIQSDENPLYVDSSITVHADGQTFVNSNDCKLSIEQEQEIVRRFVCVDGYAAQFSGATFHPTCYDYPETKKREISRFKREAKYKRIIDSICRLGARAYFFSAGPPSFLSEDLFHLNCNDASIFSTPLDFLEYLREQSLSSQTFVVPMPGELYSLNDVPVLHDRSQIEKIFSKEYIRGYADAHKQEIQEELERYRLPVGDIMNDAREHFNRLLECVPELAQKASVALEVVVEGENGGGFVVDCTACKVRDDMPESPEQIYVLRISTFWMRAIIEKLISWEDMILSFRFQLHREPDIYNEAIIAFLQLETAQERQEYVEYVDSIRNRRPERMCRTVNGKLVEYDRFCPHNGEDLANAVIMDDALVCTRHFWRFSLIDGRGINNACNIRLIEKENPKPSAAF